MLKSFAIFLSLILLFSLAQATVTYDGLWFLGFNLASQHFQGAAGLELRQKICRQVDRGLLAKKIMGAENVPDSFIPLGMPGYSPQQDFFQYVPQQSKAQAITLNLLHTDGVKTEKIVRELRQELAGIGIALISWPVNYSEPDRFEESLRTGGYDLFLMGYKAEEGSTKEMLQELFTGQGKANFFRLNDTELDSCINALGVSADLKAFDKVQQILWEKQILLPIFYIESF